MPTNTPGPLVIQLAFDGFESANASGGYGWLGPWQSSGPFVIGDEDPHAGDWQLDLFSGVDLLSTNFVYRMADLAAYDDVHLRFWSRLSRVGKSDRDDGIGGASLPAQRVDQPEHVVLISFRPQHLID